MTSLKTQINLNDIEDNIVTNIFYVEKYLGHTITETYPYIKLLVEIEELHKHLEKENNR